MFNAADTKTFERVTVSTMAGGFRYWLRRQGYIIHTHEGFPPVQDWRLA